MAKRYMRIHIGNQLGMQPGKLSDDLKFRLTALPETALAMSSVQKEAAESGKLRPANVKNRGDCIWRTRFGGPSLPLGWFGRGGLVQITFPLTPALSLGERENRRRRGRNVWRNRV